MTATLDPILKQSLEALGLPLVAPEPEVVQSILASAHARTLASVIADLINDNEPLLKAEAEGATVTVRERGGPAVMTVTVTAGEAK